MNIRMRAAVALMALALALAPAASYITPSSTLMSKATLSSRFATRRFVLGGLKNLGQQLSGESTAEDLSLENDNKAFLADCEVRAQRINAMEPEFEALSDGELRAKTKAFKARLDGGETLEDILEEAFAVVREASWRVLELRHYDVQLIGGMVLHDGRLAEMATGEGKTLAATLPTYLHALTGKGALVVTANEYLARRDAETVGQVYRLLGLTVGLVCSGLDDAARREAYACSITYATNAELGFDYLRDNLALSPDQVVGPPPDAGPSFCLVDEADSILVDEARTPLIIAKQVAAPAERYELAQQMARVLVKDEHYQVDIKGNQVTITDKGFVTCENLLGKSMFDATDPWAPFVLNAIKAKELFVRDTHYIVRPGEAATGGEADAKPPRDEVCIVDPFSGRVMVGRRWSDGMHQSIEAKEGLDVSTESQTTATVTYQSLFRRYANLCGMTGTAMGDAKELRKVYNLKVTPVPTALPVARRDYPDAVYRTGAAKIRAVVAEVVREASTGRPVLVGTTSVASSEQVAAALRKKMGDQAHRLQVLNAKPENVDREGEVVGQAGRLGAVTVSTNMAGRGTDILLGGNPGLLANLRIRDALASSGCLMPDAIAPTAVAASGAASTSGEEGGGASSGGDADDDDTSSAAAMAPVKPKAQQGRPGPPQWTPMPEDYYPAPLSEEALALVAGAAKALLGDPSRPDYDPEVDGPLDSLLELEELVAVAAEKAPIRDPAVRAIRAAYNQAKSEFATALAPEKQKVRELGGLMVLGTERHESRRIDGQLRGRAGRQGDPGGSRFFLALDDPMLKTFGADRLQGVLDAFRVAEDVPLESKQVTDAIDKIQARVEEYYAGIREQIFVFDDVLSMQRNALYRRRAAILQADDESLAALVREYCADTLKDVVSAHLKKVEAKAVAAAGGSDEGEADEDEDSASTSASSSDAASADASDWPGLSNQVAAFFPGVTPPSPTALADAYGTAKDTTALLALLQGLVDAAAVEKKAALEVERAPTSDGQTGSRQGRYAKVFQYLALVQLDNGWSEHLRGMGFLKEAVVMRKYLGRDPLDEYVAEAALLFQSFLDASRRNTAYSLFAYQVPPVAK